MWDLEFLKHGNTFYSGNSNGTILKWDLNLAHKFLKIFEIPGKKIFSVSMSPNDNYIAISGDF